MTHNRSAAEPAPELGGITERAVSSIVTRWTLLTDVPERDQAGVEAGTGHASVGPSWNSSRTSDLFFLQEQIRAM